MTAATSFTPASKTATSEGLFEGPNASTIASWLRQAAHAAPSADNAQPWRCDLIDGALEIRHDGERLRDPLGGPDTHMSQLSLGAMLENLHQGAAFAGIALHCPDDAPLRFDATPLPGTESGVPNTAPPLFARHTNRHPFRRSSLDPDLLSELGAQTEGSARVVVSEGRRALGFLAEQVRIASLARFQTQQLHEWLMGSLRWTPEQAASGEGLDVRTLHLPPGGRGLLRLLVPWRRMRLLARIGGHRLMARMEGVAFRSAGAAVTIVGDQDARSAGRLMQRVWVRLNEEGLGVHPFYVVADQHGRLDQGTVPEQCTAMLAEAQRACASRLGLASGERIQIMFRVGVPTRTALRSLRLNR